MASKIYSPRKMTLETLKTKMKQDEEKLRKIFFRREIAEHFHRSKGYSVDISQEAAHDIVYRGAAWQTNSAYCEDSTLSQLIKAARASDDTMRDMSVLMLAFPVELQGYRIFMRDCHARRLQNEDYVRRRFGRDDVSATYEEILWYRWLCCCFCEIHQDLDQLETVFKNFSDRCEDLDTMCEQIMRRQFSEDEEALALPVPIRGEALLQPRRHRNQQTIVHNFLHIKCHRTLVAQIVFNGHGREGDSDDEKGGLLYVHVDGTVRNQQIIDDIDQCFKSIPVADPPFRVYIVFAQCHADRDGLQLDVNDDTLCVHCLSKPGHSETNDVYIPEYERSYHMDLVDFAQQDPELSASQPTVNIQ